MIRSSLIGNACLHDEADQGPRSFLAGAGRAGSGRRGPRTILHEPLSLGRPATIVLAEDHEVVRQGLRALLEREPGFSVVGEASDGLQVADLVERTKPNVLILDLMMPGLGGLDVAREVARRSPQTRIVVLSMHSSESIVVQAFRNGASAYLVKHSGAAELVRAIREVLAGRRYLGPPLSDKAVDVYVARAKSDEVDVYELLTARERQVLPLAAEGLSNPAIGERLGISRRTAQTHRAHIMEKLGLRTRRDLIVYAMNHGLLPPAPDDRLSGGAGGGQRELVGGSEGAGPEESDND